MGFYGLPWTPDQDLTFWADFGRCVHVVLRPFLPNLHVGKLQEFNEFNSSYKTCVPVCMHALCLTPLVNPNSKLVRFWGTDCDLSVFNATLYFFKIYCFRIGITDVLFFKSQFGRDTMMTFRRARSLSVFFGTMVTQVHHKLFAILAFKGLEHNASKYCHDHLIFSFS